MTETMNVFWSACRERAKDIAKILDFDRYIYGIPNGGIHAANVLYGVVPGKFVLVEDPDEADAFIDDIIDSGKTRDKYKKIYPHKHFVALVDKQGRDKDWMGQWVTFPWERMRKEHAPEDAVTRLLQYIGEDPSREGLRETPQRVLKSLKEMLSGYSVTPESIIKTFEDGACDEMVLLRDISLSSMCLSGSSMIETPRGRIPINKLKHGAWVYCYDRKSKGFDLVKCQNPRITRRNAELVRVYMDKETLICTPDHKILTYKKGWIKAENLMAGDSVVAFSRSVSVDSGGNSRVSVSIAKQGRDGYKYGKTCCPEARLVFDLVYGQQSYDGFDIHHKNGNTFDNRPSNLELLCDSEHIKIHAKKDGRGKREAERWKNMTSQEREAWERARKKALEQLHEDEERRAKMIEKRRDSLYKYWDIIRENPELYAERTKNMKGPNHRIIGIERLSWKEDVWCMDVPDHNNFFANGICVHNCEHHMLPFVGKAHVAYIPNKRIIGISKLARLVEMFAKRLQVQERLTTQITACLDTHLQPLGSACVIEAEHMCMACRGILKKDATMVTSSLTGKFRDYAVRSEFFHLVRQ